MVGPGREQGRRIKDFVKNQRRTRLFSSYEGELGIQKIGEQNHIHSIDMMMMMTINKRRNEEYEYRDIDFYRREVKGGDMLQPFPFFFCHEANIQRRRAAYRIEKLSSS